MFGLKFIDPLNYLQHCRGYWSFYEFSSWKKIDSQTHILYFLIPLVGVVFNDLETSVPDVTPFMMWRRLGSFSCIKALDDYITAMGANTSTHQADGSGSPRFSSLQRAKFEVREWKLSIKSSLQLNALILWVYFFFRNIALEQRPYKDQKRELEPKRTSNRSWKQIFTNSKFSWVCRIHTGELVLADSQDGKSLSLTLRKSLVPTFSQVASGVKNSA